MRWGIPAEPDFQRRTRRVWEYQREVVFARPQGVAHVKHAVVQRERNRFVDGGMFGHKSASFSGVSKAMCASGNFSRSRSSAGVVITASPSQFVPRTRTGEDGG